MHADRVASNTKTVNDAARRRAAWNGVSYLEWFKLIGTAFLISSGMTAVGIAFWWLALK